MNRRDGLGKQMSRRDRIEDVAEHNPLFLAEVLLMEALEMIESYAHEDSSVIAHRALHRFKSTVFQ